MQTFQCPRRRENRPIPGYPEHDEIRSDDSCSYCGSLNPDTFMARIEAGTIEVVPTDKSYKAYVTNQGGEDFKQTYRKCPPDSTCTGPQDCTHWVTRDISQAKFYYMHLSTEQKDRFIELFNTKAIKIGVPGHFYVWPYFMRPVQAAEGN